MIRVLRREDIEVYSVKLSKERRDTQNANSVIVVVKNETNNHVASYWRYRQNPSTNWIEEEFLFTTMRGNSGTGWYESVEFFDDYAIGFKNNRFYVLFYKEFLGETIPSNYEVFAYDQGDDSDILNYSYYDRSGVNGEWELFILVKYPSALAIHPVTMVISPSTYSPQFSME